MIKQPKNQEQAIDLIHKLAQKFKIQVQTLTKSELEETEECDNWTDAQFREAMQAINDISYNDSSVVMMDVIKDMNSKSPKKKKKKKASEEFHWN